MNDSQKVLLELIKKSQFGKSDDFIYSDNINWDSVREEAVHQTVIGIIAQEIPENIYNSDKIWIDLKNQVNANTIRYYSAEAELIKLLDKSKVPFVILKGTSVSIYYKYPLRRVMGDIDFLVPEGWFDKTMDILTDNGYMMVSEHQTIRNIGLIKNGISYEIHKRFSHEDIDIENYLISGIDNRIIVNIGSLAFPVLPKLPNGLVLLDHMRNHLQSGLGLRQVVDWMMYVNTELTDDFWYKEFSSVVDSLGLTRFAIVVTRMCQLYLGLSDNITWCKSADDDVCRKLLDLIFQSGNFGCKTGKGMSVELVRSQIREYGLFRWLQIAGEHNWKAYNRYAWLKPLCWIYQLFRYSIQGIKSGRAYSELSDDLERSKNRYELMKELEISFDD